MAETEARKRAVRKYRLKTINVSVIFNMESEDDTELLQNWNSLASEHGGKKKALSFLINKISDT